MSKKYDKSKNIETILSNDEILMNSFDEEIDNNEDDSSNNSENISEVSDDEFDPNDEEDDENEKFAKTKFLESVIKYLGLDDTIRKENNEFREKIKIMKEDKNNLEVNILRFLERSGDNFIEIKGKGKLIKNKSETKAPVKSENIREGIYEGLKKEKLIEEDEKMLEIINGIMDKIDEKRTVNSRTYLKRTYEKDEKKKGKKK